MFGYVCCACVDFFGGSAYIDIHVISLVEVTKNPFET